MGEAIGEMVGPQHRRQLQGNLEQLAQLTAARPHLVGDKLSLADLAVVAQLSLLRFPASSGAPLAGRGVSGIADNPVLQPLFNWRDQVLAQLAPG
jgi:glutathione S-transferase